MGKYIDYDPWGHLEEEGGFVKIKAPKIKKIKKEIEFIPKKKRKRK